MINSSIIKSQYTELNKVYQRLKLNIDEHKKQVFVYGVLDFSGDHNDIIINDSFEIEIIINDQYPAIPPITKETGGRIPKNFHTNIDDQSLCLGAPLYIRMTFSQNPSLIGYINDLVIPYFFSFCFWQMNGKMPFGELSHGGKGLLEYYQDLFSIEKSIITLELMKILAEGNYRGHLFCPCRSGKIIRNCHGELLRKINQYQTQDNFIDDFLQCLAYLRKSEQTIPASLKSKKIIDHLQKQQLRREQKCLVNK
jgi:hypothetical protein